MEIEITGVTLVSSRSGTDTIFLETNLPSGTFPFSGKATITLVVARDHGRNYIRDNFPNVPFEDLT
jgi:hypothetical protein